MVEKSRINEGLSFSESDVGKTGTRTRYFHDQKYGFKVIIEILGGRSFVVSFMSSSEKLQAGPTNFKKRVLERALANEKAGLVEIAIGDKKGFIKTSCLKGFLEKCSADK